MIMIENTIRVHDKTFVEYIAAAQIQAAVQTIAAQINADYAEKRPLFIGVLNGSFMFAADLLKYVTIPCEISFVKLQSYSGMGSTGKVVEAIGLTEVIKNRHLIIIEDIIDTGRTLSGFVETLAQAEPDSVAIATLLLKPEALQVPIAPRYCGIEIPNKFVVGYGLDYDGLGRNFASIYQLCE
jgi:hypoxanthine phosphoribosyltransferase